MEVYIYTIVGIHTYAQVPGAIAEPVRDVHLISGCRVGEQIVSSSGGRRD